MGKARGRCSRNGSEWRRNAGGGSRRVGLAIRGVEGLVCCMVLVHLDSEVEPGLWLCVRGSAHCHPCQGSQDLTVKASSQLDHNSLGVGVSTVLNEVSELVQIVVDCSFTLEVGGGLQCINSCSFGVERHKVPSELVFEVGPINKAKMSRLNFVFELASCPTASASSFHVGHSPDDLGGIVVIEGFQA